MYYADHFNDKIKVKQKSDCCDQDGSIVEELRFLSLFRIRLTVPEFAVEEYVFMRERRERESGRETEKKWKCGTYSSQPMMYICVILILF